jgi:selenocysteine lyase/cysteine desulfurase
VIDVQDLDVEFLACSAYKFYGPHIGLLYGKYDLMDSLKAYKVRPASNALPGKFETGTQSFEGIAGVLGSLEHLAWIGQEFGEELVSPIVRQSGLLHKGMAAVQAHEANLTRRLLERLRSNPRVHIYGQDDPLRLENRVPTISINLQGKHPRQVAEALAAEEIYVWNGNYYALSVTERLGVEDSGGMVRIGAAQYNTLKEVEQLGDALEKIAQS